MAPKNVTRAIRFTRSISGASTRDVSGDEIFGQRRLAEAALPRSACISFDGPGGFETQGQGSLSRPAGALQQLEPIHELQVQQQLVQSLTHLVLAHTVLLRHKPDHRLPALA